MDRRARVLMALMAASLACCSPAAAIGVVRAGPARFQVLTPTLIRMEYAADRAFENGPTLTVVRARRPAVAFAARVLRGWLVISTARSRLAYRLGSGPFAGANLRLSFAVGARRVTVHPVAGSAPGNLGGWTRALDNQDAPVPLHDGLLARGGWYVLDDSATVLLRGGGYRLRPAHRGAYQDWYLFTYGHDYARGLADLRALTGPAPLLPRSAFGVWFSRYYPYSESGYHTLLGQFAANRVPLDTLSVDTDFKHVANAAGAAVAAIIAGAPGLPYSWNGWEWDTTLFPDPQRFIDWAHGRGLSLAVNIHPSIDTTDPRYGATVAQAGPLTADSGCRILQADPLGTCMTFNWSDPRQLAAYFALQRPFAQQGIDMFWLDWCCEGVQPVVPGLTSDTWINSRYFAAQRARGSRWPAFSRIGASYGTDGPDGDRGVGDGGDGAFAEHRYSIQFTGDTCATWAMLAFEARMSAAEGNIGLPYVSHDIGSYNGEPGNLPCGAADEEGPAAAPTRHLPDDLYARWVQFGTFQPLDRLHSNHGDRLPWSYGAAADASAASFLRLREALDPYTYTLARRAYDTGLPITGALFVMWPGQSGAYQHPSEYTFGPDMVIAPVVAAGDPAPAVVWVPPGTWIDYFTGRRYVGPAVRTLSVPLSRMPVLVRAGAVVVTQPFGLHTAAGPASHLIVTAFPGAHGSLSLYDDQGVGFGYQRGMFSFTRLVADRRGRAVVVRIGPARGWFPGFLRKRSWTIVSPSVARPRRVELVVRGRIVTAGRRRWSYDRATRTLTVTTGPMPTRRGFSVVSW